MRIRNAEISNSWKLSKLLLLLLCILMYFCPTELLAEISPAGVSISSRSYAVYGFHSSRLTAYSNELSFNVLPFYSPLVVPDGSVEFPAAVDSAFSGEHVSYAFSLTNGGNGPDSYRLSLRLLNPSDFSFSSRQIYLDEDGDGSVDPGEQAVTSVGPLTAGETAALVVTAMLPSGLSGGESAHLNLSAVSESDTSRSDRNNVARAVARQEAHIPLHLSADRQEAMPGDTVRFTIDFSNTGSRTASDLIITDYIDQHGNIDNTRYVDGSLESTAAGALEYLDGESGEWVQIEPPADRVKGIRLRLNQLEPAEGGQITFLTEIMEDHLSSYIYNSSFADYTGGDSRPYQAVSNEVAVLVSPVSELFIGPSGNPDAPRGSPEDVVINTLNLQDSIYTFEHEIMNSGNFLDTLAVAFSDSTVLPEGWSLEFVDSTGAVIREGSGFTAVLGPVPPGESVEAGLRFRSTPERFRSFQGSRLEFEVEAFSAVNGEARDDVRDVFIKSGIAMLSVQQSIKEPVAEIGDLLSCILTVNNLTEDTMMDSLIVTENLCAGVGFAGGSIIPDIRGNRLEWEIGSLGPGEEKKIVFRLRVKVGQQRGRLAATARVRGISEYGEEVYSEPAVASIKLVEGIFTRKGILLGNIYFDSNGSGKRESWEKGVEGVSVFLENGTYCVTDSSGGYSIPGLDEGVHVLRIDPQSLPDSLAPADAGYYGLGEKGEVMVELPPSGSWKVDFPLEKNRFFMDKDLETTGAEFIEPPLQAEPERADTTTLTAASIPDSSDIREQAAEPEPPYLMMVFDDRNFSAGSDMISGIPLDKVARLSLWLRNHPGWKLNIVGHTDSMPISTEEFPSNLELSVARARSVFQLFRMNGIDEKVLDFTGKGARVPVAANSTPEGRAKNRRVEVKAVPPEGYTYSAEDLAGWMPQDRLSPVENKELMLKILRPEEGRVFRKRDRIEVFVVTDIGSAISLYVNGLPVEREKIGQKEIDAGKRTISHIYYDVKIETGDNELMAVSKRNGRKAVLRRNVYLSGNPETILPEVKRVSVPADGKTDGEIVFLVRDGRGLPVRDGIFVNVKGPKALIAESDANPDLMGVQAITRDGKITVTVPPSREDGEARISVVKGSAEATSVLNYESPLRDWFLFGYGEADIGVGSINGSGSLHRAGRKFNDGLFAEGKISLYGQGKVMKDHLLTLAVDTRPTRYDRLLDRIEPEKHYPLYGDAGELKFNSSSRSGTYIRLDHQKYSAMFGDFHTGLGGDLELTRYNRTFTGFRGETGFEKGKIQAFITRTDQVTYQEEIPADGTSGFYFLKHYPLIENSEKIRIEVRDRYRPEKIIRVDYKKVNRDYDLNYNDGSILFKEPIPSVDEDLNPVTIVVSYECSNSDEQNFIYGARSTVNVTDRLTAGVTAFLEEEGEENSSMVGMDISGRILPSLEVEGEFGRSEKYLHGSGDAYRIRFKGKREDYLLWSAYYRKIDQSFFNPSFTGGKTELGSRKYGLDFDWKFRDRFRLLGKHYHHKFMERDEKKDYAHLAGSYSSDLFDSRLGLARAYHEAMDEGEHEAIMIRTSVSAERENIKAQLSYDQKISGEEVEEYPDRLEAKISRKVWDNIRAVLDHEYRTGSRSGARHRTRLGVESEINENLSVYSRYSLEGAVSGERGQATMGLKNRFRLSEGLTGTVAAENLSTVSGAEMGDFTSIATGWNYTPPESDYMVKGNYELKLENERNKHLFSAGGIKRVNRCWSGMFKGDIWFTNEYAAANRAKVSSTLGVSCRSHIFDGLTLLSLIKSRYEKNSPSHPGGIDKEMTVSAEANYRFNRYWQAEGKTAARWVKNTFKKYSASSSTFMYQARVIRILASGWDISLTGRLIHQRETGTLRSEGGLEVGKVIMRNIWVGAGYDFADHNDHRAGVNDFSQIGFHVGMRMKFNEKLLNYFYQ